MRYYVPFTKQIADLLTWKIISLLGTPWYVDKMEWDATEFENLFVRFYLNFFFFTKPSHKGLGSQRRVFVIIILIFLFKMQVLVVITSTTCFLIKVVVVTMHI